MPEISIKWEFFDLSNGKLVFFGQIWCNNNLLYVFCNKNIFWLSLNIERIIGHNANKFHVFSRWNESTILDR